MEFERVLSRQDADSKLLALRREWVARSARHLAAHERATFIVIRRSAESRHDRLGANDSIPLDSEPGEADLALALLERAPRFTRASFLGIAPRSAVFEREKRLWVPVSAFEEPRPPEEFKFRAPSDFGFLSHYDLSVEARRAMTQSESTRPDLVYLRLYLLVFCFHDDDERYATIRASVGDEMAAHLDQLRSRCSTLELGPEMSKLRGELRQETS